MAGANIVITDSGFRDATDGYVRKLEDYTPVFTDFGEYMLRETELRFEAGKDPEGNAWKPLKPLTKKRKKHNRILVESHNLKDRFAYEADATRMAYGTNVVYAARHQFGDEEAESDDEQKGLIPARSFLGFNQADRDYFAELEEEHINADA